MQSEFDKHRDLENLSSDTVETGSCDLQARREFLASTAALGILPLLSSATQAQETRTKTTAPVATSGKKSLIGGYGSWAAGLVSDPPQLSFRLNRWSDVRAWRRTARSKASELIASPRIDGDRGVKLIDKFQFDGLEIERLSWQLPYGPETQAVLLKPQSAAGPLPGILGLHDHGGNKYFGNRKITRSSSSLHPLMLEHQRQYYGGRAWANEIAKRGYVVLVHDAFTFASRRVLFQDMAEIPWGPCKTTGMSDDAPESTESIKAYNDWASAHEHVMAKSLFSAGTTWPGVFLAEDQAALSVLSSRSDVDENRIGCAGLSGGGLRTVYLGGLDPRIKCAICVGFMSTWHDFLLNKSYTHTWMTYAPLLPKYLDFPEVLGLRVPLPTMTLSNNDDALYTLPEMKRADKILQDVYGKAGAAERYRGRFYAGGHKFDQQMQLDAFDWFDRWLI